MKIYNIGLKFKNLKKIIFIDFYFKLIDLQFLGL
jgi:hypothetical protein